MTWVTWRQRRGQVLVTAGFLAVLGAVLLGYSVVVAGRLAEFAADEAGRLTRLTTVWSDASVVLPWLAAVPAAIGSFWGAPLLARGPHQLARKESRTWLLVRLGELGGMVVLTGLVFGVLVTAWVADVAPVAEAGRLPAESLFAVTGVVPAAWWLFAFVLGTTVGALVRRLLPALAVTLAVFLAAHGAVLASDVREHYATPERLELTTPAVAGESWRTSTPAVADRYWRFQWTEAGILLLATTLLGGALANRVARRGAST